MWQMGSLWLLQLVGHAVCVYIGYARGGGAGVLHAHTVTCTAAPADALDGLLCRKLAGQNYREVQDR